MFQWNDFLAEPAGKQKADLNAELNPFISDLKWILIFVKFWSLPQALSYTNNRFIPFTLFAFWYLFSWEIIERLLGKLTENSNFPFFSNCLTYFFMTLNSPFHWEKFFLARLCSELFTAALQCFVLSTTKTRIRIKHIHLLNTHVKHTIPEQADN